MNYNQSAEILEKIKGVDRILVNCHRNTDPDSIGSALALDKVLSDMGKKVEIVSPTKLEWQALDFLKNYKKIKTVDFSKFDFSKYQLFIILDSSSWDMVTDTREFTPPKIPVVVIDHHRTNEKFGEINLVDERITSTSELLYLILQDWGVGIDKQIADSLLTGIIGDTGAFSYAGVGAETLKTTGELMQKGANKDRVVDRIFRTVDFELVQFWGEAIRNAKIDKVGKFVWSAIPNSRFRELGSLLIGRETAAGVFANIVEGTDFGIVMVEIEPKRLAISFRSRTGLDVSVFSKKLGGGGHRYASGARVEGLKFDDAVAKVMTVVRGSINEAKKS